MIQPERVRRLNANPVLPGRYVLYWMQAAQRTLYNHALEFAIDRANEIDKPLVVGFGLTDSYPEGNARHYQFMLEGLAETRRSLAQRGIRIVVLRESPESAAVRLSTDACLAVVDAGYLRIQKQWRTYASEHMPCALIQVETNVVVPVESASPKEEFSAATLRRKITPMLARYLVPVKERKVARYSLDTPLTPPVQNDISLVATQMRLDTSVQPVLTIKGGSSEAVERLNGFIAQKLALYPALRNDPAQDVLSDMSPYLHFGQISPLYIALRIRDSGSPGADAYLEELIVRRELSMNFVHYNPSYDSYDGLPEWVKRTLTKHRDDPRPALYTEEQLERAETHDRYWNAAQRQMLLIGKMHGYMRMYWGKKILEWSKTPEAAFRAALRLNNKYELDGRDPNGYAGVAWCFGKHDRPWPERPVFGSVRYMNAAGLKAKFDADAYAQAMEGLADAP